MFRMVTKQMSRLQQHVPFRLLPALFCIFVFWLVYLMPAPAGLTLQAWHFLAFFAAAILGIILKVMPIGAMSIIIMTAVMITQYSADSSAKAVTAALSSMNNSLIWLIVISVIVARGLAKTGLGARIGYYFIALLGRRTLGIGYGLAICEFILSPVTPSNTARGGGIVHPIMRSIAYAFDSNPENNTQGRVGTYLALVNYHANPITSAMFITSTAPNPLVVNYIAQATNMQFQLTWSTWALCMVLPGLVALLLMPLVIYWISPPQVKATPDAVGFAHEELKKLGPIKAPEWLMLTTFAVMLLLWAGVPAAIFGAQYAIDATAVSFVGLVILLASGVLSWNDVLSEKSAWDTLIWFGALVMLAGQLNNLGIISWFSQHLQLFIEESGMGWQWAMVLLVLAFLYSHYLFASTTAHISAMLLAFLLVGAQIVPPDYINIFMLLMLSASAIMMTLTHYATGTSPVIFSSGFVTLGRWWGVGLIMSVVNMAVFTVIGMMWWRFLGF